MAWILLLLFLVAFAIWLQAKNNNKTGTRLVRHRHRSNRYHAVLVKTRGRGCAEIQAFKGKTFLAHNAPVIPLTDCSASNCGCRYMHLADRRQQERRTRFGVSPIHYGLKSKNRRSGNDRRRAVAAVAGLAV